MARRASSSKLRSAISRYNSAVRNYNAKRRREINNYNNAVRNYNAKRRRVIDEYNRNVREYNRRRRTYRTQLQSARSALARRPSVTGHYSPIHSSAVALADAYDRLDLANADPYLSDLAERETANSLTVVNHLIGDAETGSDNPDSLSTTKIAEELSSISPELNDRWHGAIFALDPRNSDAARHFCTSSREIIADILNTKAPDTAVLDWNPGCQLTERGTPTRRAKVLYCLDRLGVANTDLENFIDTNVRDLTVLFNDLNAGAHGPAGKFSLPQLSAIKSRVEDAIIFMREIAT